VSKKTTGIDLPEAVLSNRSTQPIIPLLAKAD